MTLLNLCLPMYNLIFAFGSMIGLGAVSYTHLDVYKRQVGEQHDQAIHAEAQAARGGQAVLQSVDVVVVHLGLAEMCIRDRL